jgi:hypothetical protein
MNPRHLTPQPKTNANPEGKGVSGFLADWRATEPRGIVAKPQRQVLAELFTSMLVLSASFKYRPAPGVLNYLYWMDGQWSLSLIAPQQWSQQRRDNYVGMCMLHHDMTWTIDPSERLAKDSPVASAVRRYYVAFAEMLNTKQTLEEILPFHVGSLPYYQRLYAAALSRSVAGTLSRGEHTSISCRDWRKQLSNAKNELPARVGFDLSAGH